MKYYYKLKDGSFRIIEDEDSDATENIKDTIKAIETMYRERKFVPLFQDLLKIKLDKAIFMYDNPHMFNF